MFVTRLQRGALGRQDIGLSPGRRRWGCGGSPIEECADRARLWILKRQPQLVSFLPDSGRHGLVPLPMALRVGFCDRSSD